MHFFRTLFSLYSTSFPRETMRLDPLNNKLVRLDLPSFYYEFDGVFRMNGKHKALPD
jgi:hypothetical protein